MKITSPKSIRGREGEREREREREREKYDILETDSSKKIIICDFLIYLILKTFCKVES